MKKSKKIQLKEADFRLLEKHLFMLGFRVITRTEQQRNFARLGVNAKKPIISRETGFTIEINGLRVVIWPSWLEKEKKFRDIGDDKGYVIIFNGDRKEYVRKLYRTKSFPINLLRHAWVAKWRAEHRHICLKCKKFMQIGSGPSLGSKYWYCANKTAHPETIRVNWDKDLPPKAKEFVEFQRALRARGRKHLRALGKEPGSRMFQTKWTTSRPENRLPAR